jgi:sporulation protein YlmC with PRC-barrel domain
MWQYSSEDIWNMSEMNERHRMNDINKVKYMATKLSKLYGMEIFTDSGKYIGNAQDFILDFESGEVLRILTEGLPAGKDDVRKALREKSILYKNVKSVEDVIVITKGLTAPVQQ